MNKVYVLLNNSQDIVEGRRVNELQLCRFGYFKNNLPICSIYMPRKSNWLNELAGTSKSFANLKINTIILNEINGENN